MKVAPGSLLFGPQDTMEAGRALCYRRAGYLPQDCYCFLALDYL
jgi:hypothetical protein